jgi:FAD:protein FMN transferase
MDERPHVGSSRWAGNLSRRVFLGRSGMGLLATMASGLSLVPERQSQARPLATFRQARYIMGTIVEIAVAAPDQHTAYQAMAHGFQALKQVDQRMSIYQAGSELCRVNRLAAGRWVHTDTDILTVMTEALSLSHLSHGGLDVTVLPLMQLWGFVQRAGRIPTADEVRATLSLVDYRHIQVDLERRAIRFDRQGVEMDFGGIAKGFAVDRAIDILLAHGVDHALVNAGGDLFALGAADADTAWIVDIQHPTVPAKSLGTLRVRDRSIATSGDYEKYFEQNGKRYCHLIDPRTGYPVQGVASVTVLADTAMRADALSTAVFALGAEEGLALLEGLPGVDGVIAAKRQHKRDGLDIRMTSGLKDVLTLTEAG